MKPKPPASDAPPRKRVLMVDDHPFLRQGVTQSLNGEDWLTVCGEASNAEEALGAAQKLRPDLVITDLTLPGKSGLELIKDLAAMAPELPVIVLSLHDERIYAERCLRAGARGYLMKQEGPEKLLAAIRQVLLGRPYVSENMVASLVNDVSGRPSVGSPFGRLTDREFEIFQLIGEGRSAREIALQLHLSPKTVDAHREHIRGKLNLQRSADLLRYAVRWLETETAGGSTERLVEKKSAATRAVTRTRPGQSRKQQ